MRVANEVKNVTNWAASALLYKLTEPVAYEPDSNNKQGGYSEYIVVSYYNNVYGNAKEYAAFATDDKGAALSWLEVAKATGPSARAKDVFDILGYELGPPHVNTQNTEFIGKVR